MVVPSYPCSGIISDVDGTTAMEGATVTAYNCTKHEWLPDDMKGTTNAAGEYIIDLANFPTDYSDGDKVHILAYYGNKHIDVRHTIDIGVGSFEQNMYLHDGEPWLMDTRIEAIHVSNENAAAKYVDIYDRYNDARRIRISVGIGQSHSIYFGKKGFLCQDGICIVYETGVTATDMQVAIKQSGL